MSHGHRLVIVNRAERTVVVPNGARRTVVYARSGMGPPGPEGPLGPSGMSQLIYDPNNIAGDVFDAGNLVGSIDGGTFN